MQAMGERTGNITQAVAMQKSVTDTIADLVGRTSENTRNVSLSIAEVSNDAATNRTIAGKVHAYSNEISEQLTKLLQNTTTRMEQLASVGVASIDEARAKTDNIRPVFDMEPSRDAGRVRFCVLE